MPPLTPPPLLACMDSHPCDSFGRKQNTSNPKPNTALIADPNNVPVFPAASISPCNAKPAINNDIVKPIPARQPAPHRLLQFTPLGRRASPSRTANQLNPTIPRGFPTTSPTPTATDT